MRLTLNLARRILYLLQRQKYTKVAQAAKLMGKDKEKLVEESFRFIKNAERKGINVSPIKEPNILITNVSEKKFNQLPLKEKYKAGRTYDRIKPGDKQIKDRGFPQFEADDFLQPYTYERTITGKGRRNLLDYIEDNMKKQAKQGRIASRYDRPRVDKKALREANRTHKELYEADPNLLMERLRAENQINLRRIAQKKAREKESDRILMEMMRIAKEKKYQS